MPLHDPLSSNPFPRVLYHEMVTNNTLLTKGTGVPLTPCLVHKSFPENRVLIFQFTFCTLSKSLLRERRTWGPVPTIWAISFPVNCQVGRVKGNLFKSLFKFLLQEVHDLLARFYFSGRHIGTAQDKKLPDRLFHFPAAGKLFALLFSSHLNTYFLSGGERTYG